MTNGGALFVALPAATDPIHELISEPDAHVTLTYFGNAEEINARYPEVCADLLEVGDFVAENSTPFTSKAAGRAELGDEGARVLLMESLGLVQLYQTLLSLDPVDMLMVANPDRYPWWIPHLTYSYDEASKPFDLPEKIAFDRLALWWGEDRQTWDLTGPAMEMPVSAACLVPQIECVSDLAMGIRVAEMNPGARWYVERRAKALGHRDLLPSWAGA